MSDLNGHRLDVAANGALTTAHPPFDVEACGFEDYVQRDWTGDSVPRPSSWDFVRRTDDETGAVDWFGSRLDTPGVPS